MTKISFIPLIFLFVSSLLLSACTSPQLTPEQEIKQWLQQAIESAEDRDSKAIKANIHMDYNDRRKLTKKSLGQLIQLYFFRHKNIHLFHKIQSINIIGSNDANVSFYLAMAGTDINALSMLSSLRAKVYLIDLELIKHDDWQVINATWTPANVSDIQ